MGEGKWERRGITDEGKEKIKRKKGKVEREVGKKKVNKGKDKKKK